MRPEIPQDKVVVCAIGGNFVALLHECRRQNLTVHNELPGIFYKVRGIHLQELRCQSSNLVIVRTTLQGGEDSHINAVFDVWALVSVLEENHASARAPQGLVGCGGDNVAVLKWRRMVPGRNQAGDVRNVCHEETVHLFANLCKLGKINNPRVSRRTANNHRWTE